MATTTFDKEIVLGKIAAERLARILAEPMPVETKPEVSTDEKEVDEWLSRFKDS